MSARVANIFYGTIIWPDEGGESMPLLRTLRVMSTGLGDNRKPMPMDDDWSIELDEQLCLFDFLAATTEELT